MTKPWPESSKWQKLWTGVAWLMAEAIKQLVARQKWFIRELEQDASRG